MGPLSNGFVKFKNEKCIVFGFRKCGVFVRLSEANMIVILFWQHVKFIVISNSVKFNPFSM
jgi:hypothetical protein